MTKRKLRFRLKKLGRKLKNAFGKFGTLNLILIIVAIFFVWFNWQMIKTYREYGNMPETYACAVVAATIGECGICGWIRTTKDKRQDRMWQKEDMKEAVAENNQDLPDAYDESIPVNEDEEEKIL